MEGVIVAIFILAVLFFLLWVLTLLGVVLPGVMKEKEKGCAVIIFILIIVVIILSAAASFGGGR
jgi:predicted membrane channel-forming protein YqfA (hemolysin III family)